MRPVLAAVLAAVLVLPACASAPEPFTVMGTLTLTSDAGRMGGWDAGYGPCQGMDTSDYVDVAGGAPVTVYDATGKIIGAGTLADGEPVEDVYRQCRFAFAIPNVPDVEDSDLYQVEVGRHGRVTVAKEDARAGRVALTLGDS